MHDESCDYGNNKPIVIARAKPAAIHLVVLDSRFVRQNPPRCLADGGLARTVIFFERMCLPINCIPGILIPFITLDYLSKITIILNIKEV
jgi:hypothetical protein